MCQTCKMRILSPDSPHFDPGAIRFCLLPLHFLHYLFVACLLSEYRLSAPSISPSPYPFSSPLIWEMLSRKSPPLVRKREAAETTTGHRSLGGLPNSERRDDHRVASVPHEPTAAARTSSASRWRSPRRTGGPQGSWGGTPDRFKPWLTFVSALGRN